MKGALMSSKFTLSRPSSASWGVAEGCSVCWHTLYTLCFSDFLIKKRYNFLISNFQPLIIQPLRATVLQDPSPGYLHYPSSPYCLPEVRHGVH